MMYSMKALEEFLITRQSLGIKMGLERMEKMLGRLGHPEDKVEMIHVAGTNGKGSTIQLLKAGLKANGLSVGVYSSPSFHGLKGYYEIDGAFVEEQKILECANQLYPIIKRLDQSGDGPTEFEIITTMAFLIFQNNVDYALIETGMGGKEDTTNVIQPLLSIITSISYDHQKFLGDTLALIASHKAGIIKAGQPVIIGNLPPEAFEVVEKEALQKASKLYRYGIDFKIKNSLYQATFKKSHQVRLSLKLQGEYQQHNASLAYTALILLADQNKQINLNTAKAGMEKVVLPGRFEIIESIPWLTLDAAHNLEAIIKFIETIRGLKSKKKRVLIFAGFKDKAISEMLTLLKPEFDQIILTTFNHPRAAGLEDLKNIMEENIYFKYHTSWKNIINELIHHPVKHTEYYVTGSLQFIVDIRKFVLNY